MESSFSKKIVGYDKVQVNSYIYEFEKDNTTKLEDADRRISQEIANVNEIEGKIGQLEDKLSKAVYFSAYIDKTDTEEGIVSIASDKLLQEKQVSAEDIEAFYEKENKKLEQTILNLEKEKEIAKAEFQSIMNNMYSYINNLFTSHGSNTKQEYTDGEESAEKENYINSIQDNILGKKLTRDLVDDDGNLIAGSGEIITQDIIDAAKDKNKILELFGGV